MAAVSMGHLLLALVVLSVFWGVEGFWRSYDRTRDALVEIEPWRRIPQHDRLRPARRSQSEFSFSFDKKGLLGKVSFDVDVLLPPYAMSRNITHVDVRFDPRSDLDGEVSITRGGLGFDYATVHFESNADVGRMRAYVRLESR